MKVLSCLLLVALGFAAKGWLQLSLLLATIVLAVILTSHGYDRLWRVCWMLRWLLLFTLLMHLLFTSGRTLWGVSWLSFDGLLMGVFVSVQMLMAVVTSVLLAMTTSTEELSWAFGWFVRPLQCLGCKPHEWQQLLSLTMALLPVVQTEIRACSTAEAEDHDGPAERTLLGRWSAWTQKLYGLLLRLADRGDAIAHDLAVEDSPCMPNEGPALLPMTWHDQLFAVVITLVVVCYWLAG